MNDLETLPVAVGVKSIVPDVDAEPNVKVLDALPRLLVKLVIATVPAATVNDLEAPPKVFVVPRVRVPAPIFVKLLAPDIAPFKVILPLPPTLASAPKATVPVQVDPVPEVLIRAPPDEIPVPLIVNASVAVDVSEKPFISNTAPELTDVPAAFVPRGPEALDVELAPKLNVPLLIVVAPVKVLAPESDNEPEPSLATEPEPFITPDTVKEPPEDVTSMFKGCVLLRRIFPEKVFVPEEFKLPI